MPVDRLHALLQRFAVHAEMFHSGPLCGVTDFGERGSLGQLHLIRRGVVEAHHGERRRERVEGPSLILYPRPLHHRFITDARHGADMACAHVDFHAAGASPIAQALPDVVVMPLAQVEEAASVLELLFKEAFAQACGRQQIVDRLFEVVLILILRTLMNRGAVDTGLLAGMAHPQLAKALVHMHASPGRAWPLERLATRAGMSRSQFAAVFRRVVGTTPGEYLARHRICIAQDLLRRGRPVKTIAHEVGYGSPAALSRAFAALCGQSPRAWKTAWAQRTSAAA